MTTKETSVKDNTDLVDKLTELSTKLHALLVNTYGNSGDAFRSLNNDLQDAYLWACADIAGELEKTADDISRLKV